MLRVGQSINTYQNVLNVSFNREHSLQQCGQTPICDLNSVFAWEEHREGKRNYTNATF